MYTYKKICITNRHLAAGGFLEQIEKIAHSDIDIIILREKDMSEPEYEKLAREVISICGRYGKLCVLHCFTDAAVKLNHPYIHLPMAKLRSLTAGERSFFKIIGASAHSVEEAKEAQELGASYITASHIFSTECKADLAPRGLEFLSEVCSRVNIPVYALGGINPDNTASCIENGAEGICMMSYYMKF